MNTVSKPKGTAAGEARVRWSDYLKQAYPMVKPKAYQVIIFILGVIVLSIAAFFVHLHPRPYAFDLQTTQEVQSLPVPRGVNNAFYFVSTINDVAPSIILLAAWFLGLLIIGFIVRSRGKSAIKWFECAVGLALSVPFAGGINFLYNNLVARPRPGSFGEHIHVMTHMPFKSFPSGHTAWDIAFYGFLLYLSFTEPVHKWRYRWTLIPFQIIAVLIILTIGYSRILEGEHWLTDVLAGYLSGLLWTCLAIFLYRWIIIAIGIWQRRGQSRAG